MSLEACKLCGEISKTFMHTINDKLITQFLLNAVVRLNNTEKNKNVCNLCYAKTKIVVDFITLVNKTQQNSQPQTSSASEIVVSTIHDSQSSSTNFVSIKEEHFDSPNIFYDEYGDDNNQYENDIQSEQEVQSKTEKQNLKRPKLKHGSGIRMKRAEPQKNDFRCSNCKKEHKNFKALEAHIVECFKSVEEFKCFVCDKVMETRKKLYSHMETHKVYNKRVRDPPQKLQKVLKVPEAFSDWSVKT
ncbi:unnamed protein product [Chironomus riparius]|uniref:C2H2-type domain-containing protein n=1 Tax=Chironomus riparius TaxID=315576 RepID=A0A9N9WP14_9DIPT|nr:unnamed protein product [Chironomus riparius]